jgi:hypothetical protein
MIWYVIPVGDRENLNSFFLTHHQFMERLTEEHNSKDDLLGGASYVYQGV